MAEHSSVGGTPPSWILDQNNPNCNTCANALTRAHKRLQEATVMRRKYENLDKYTSKMEFDYENYKVVSKRRIARLEEVLEKAVESEKAALGKFRALEEQNAKLTNKVEEVQILAHETVAKSQKEFTNDKGGLLAQLANKNNDLKSEKEHKQLLMKKAMELQTEINKAREEKAQDDRRKSQFHEQIESELRAENKKKDETIEWLKQTLNEREEEHKQAMKARSDLIQRVQATTPSSSMSNGTMTARIPSAHTPQIQNQAVSQNGMPASRRSSISTNLPQIPPATTGLQTGRRYKNALTTPSKDEVRQPTTPVFNLDGDQVARQIGGPGPSTPRTIYQPESRAPQHDTTSLDQMFQQWFISETLKQARQNYASGQATDLDLAMLSNDQSVKSSAMQKHFSVTISTAKGVALRSRFLQRLQAQQRQNAANMGSTTQIHSSPMIQSLPYNGGLLPTSSHHGNFASGRFQNGSPRNDATSASQNRTQPEAASPRRSPRLQKSQLTNTLLNGPKIKMPNPTQQMPALFSQNPMDVLHGIDAMRRTTNANITTPRQPQKSVPSNEWNSPANLTDLFSEPVPMFPQPSPNTSFQQPVNQGYELVDDDIEILGTTFNTGLQESSSFTKYNNSPFHSNGYFQSNNNKDNDNDNVGSQQTSNRHPQTGTVGKAYLPDVAQHGTQAHPFYQDPAPSRPPARAASRSPSRSPSRASVRGVTRVNQPKDIPDGGHCGVACKNCHHEWWNTWCDGEKQDTCYNCWKIGVDCERLQCPGFNNCNKPRCKLAHERDNFTNTVQGAKMKRKNKMTDDHDEPPRKRMKEQGGDPEWQWSGENGKGEDHHWAAVSF